MLHEAEEHGLPPVVKFDSGPYFDPNVGENWWEYYFEPVSDLPARNVSTAHLTDAELGRLAGSSWRVGLARSSELVAKYIHPRRAIVTEVDRFWREHFDGAEEPAAEKETVPSFASPTPQIGDGPRRLRNDVYVVGVHIRGTDKQVETGVRLSDDLILNTLGGLIRQIRVPWKILAASDEARYIELLKRAYGARVVSYDAIRTSDSRTPLHRLSEEDRQILLTEHRKISQSQETPSPAWRLGHDAVAECLLLARADYLVGSRSNLSRVARCFHPEAPYICLNNLADAAERMAGRRRIVPGLRFPQATRWPHPAVVKAPGVTQVNGHYHDEEPPCPLARSTRAMEHIVILPYYSRTELERFARLAGIWRRLDPGRVRYRFLLSSRFDAPAAPQSLLNELAGLAPLELHSCTTPETQFPNSASAMFFDTMEHVRRSARRDGGFALWIEADMVPLRPKWLEDFEAEWRTGHYTLMGRYMRWHDVPEHINGGACYTKDFARVVPRNIAGGWDVTCYPFVQRFGMARRTELIDFRYLSPTLASAPRSGAAIIHGVKDNSVFDYVERSLQQGRQPVFSRASSGGETKTVTNR